MINLEVKPKIIKLLEEKPRRIPWHPGSREGFLVRTQRKQLTKKKKMINSISPKNFSDHEKPFSKKRSDLPLTWGKYAPTSPPPTLYTHTYISFLKKIFFKILFLSNLYTQREAWTHDPMIKSPTLSWQSQPGAPYTHVTSLKTAIQHTQRSQRRTVLLRRDAARPRMYRCWVCGQQGPLRGS